MLNLALAPFMSSKKPLDKQIEKTVKTLDEVRKSMKRQRRQQGSLTTKLYCSQHLTPPIIPAHSLWQ